MTKHIWLLNINNLENGATGIDGFKGAGGSLIWERSKSSFLLFLTEGSVSYQMIFTGSKNIVPSQSYQILKS